MEQSVILNAVISFRASSDIYHLLMTFANRVGIDHTQQNVSVFLEDTCVRVTFKTRRLQKGMRYYPACKECVFILANKMSCVHVVTVYIVYYFVVFTAKGNPAIICVFPRDLQFTEYHAVFSQANFQV